MALNLHSYFLGRTKLFSDLCAAKLLDTNAKSFFPLFLYPTENMSFAMWRSDRVVSVTSRGASFDSRERFHGPLTRTNCLPFRRIGLGEFMCGTHRSWPCWNFRIGVFWDGGDRRLGKLCLRNKCAEVFITRNGRALVIQLARKRVCGRACKSGWTCHARACVKYWLYLADSRTPTLLQSELTEPLPRFLRISFFVYHKSLSNEPRVIHCALMDDKISVREVPSYVPPQGFAFNGSDS